MTFAPHSRLPHLDSVRGLAALAVFVNHVEWLRQSAGLPNRNHLPIVYNCGQLVVNLFFLLSGFLITHLLLGEQAARGDIGRFYARRALRIWPLYFAITLLAFFVFPGRLELLGLTAPLATPTGGQALTIFLFMLPNVAYATLPLVPFASLLWSVGVEEQFYAVWPRLSRAARRWLPAVLLALVFTLPAMRALAARAYAVEPTAAHLAWYHFLDFFRLPCLALGALAAWLTYAGPSRSVCRWCPATSLVPCTLRQWLRAMHCSS